MQESRAPGRLGHFEIVCGREVAIKALPEGLAEDGNRLARFEQEARTLASLNHPSIASIYGLEEVDARR